ncbi:unnamed protein product [Vitrella brassicaformis CCMP3155]|uniref:Uncharacterized protein n=1 Tax=Vitrella brassicaformis (strain CCMP3155) TaxID=1169540 RepID=A0A0G4GAL2_VITBC|nr:unnamed protein product [Vitrella brassicaformis CCMP3155]|eukprot:CEM26014.1 unnamed protein product [Vitrella brassicaformis CCMP3155]
MPYQWWEIRGWQRNCGVVVVPAHIVAMGRQASQKNAALGRSEGRLGVALHGVPEAKGCADFGQLVCVAWHHCGDGINNLLGVRETGLEAPPGHEGDLLPVCGVESEAAWALQGRCKRIGRPGGANVNDYIA